MNGIRLEQTGHTEWQVLLDDEPIGFVFRGRRINERQHLWYSFDLEYESLGKETLYRREAIKDLLTHHHNQPERQHP